MLKFPILFTNTDENLQTLGRGVLTNFVTATVTSEYNTVPSFTGDYLLDDPLAKELKKDRVIMVDASYKRQNQLFKIDRVTDKVDESGSRIRTVEAHHVVGELIKNSIASDLSLVNANPETYWQALMKVLSSTDISSKFKFHSDITKVAMVNLTMTEVDTLQDVLFGTEHSDKVDSFYKLYQGEWYFDNFDIYYLQHAGKDTGAVIQYGQNLKSLQQEDSILDMYTAVQPYATQAKEVTPTSAVDNATDYDGVGLVQYLGTGGLPVYDKPNGTKTGRFLQNGEHIQLAKQTTDDNSNEWLQLDDGGWIQGKHIMIDDKSAYVTNKVLGQGHIKWNISSDGNANVYQTVNGVMVANYIAGQVPIYHDPTQDSVQNGYLDKRNLRWKVFYQTKDKQGITWYNLGTNQWVSNRFVQFDKDSTYTYSQARGVGTINHSTKNKKTGKYEGVAVYSRPTHKAKIVQYVYHKQRYKIFQVADNNGTTWYDLGKNQWVPAEYVEFSKDDRDVKPQTAEDLGNKGVATPRYSGFVVVYSTPDYGQQPIEDAKLYSGDTVNIVSQAQTGQGTWYQITSGSVSGWINGNYIDFGKDTDVKPYDPDQDIQIEEPKDVTLTLPEVFIKSENADKYEFIKIKKVDLSQYNITDIDKLRTVAKAYIYDNRIGEEPINLDVEYYQMRGELEHLTQADIYDLRTVYFPKTDTNVTAEVSKAEWDVTKHRWISLHFGDLPLTLRDTLEQYLKKADNNSRMVAKETKGAIDKSLELQWEKFHQQALTDLGVESQNWRDEFSTINGEWHTEFNNAKVANDESIEKINKQLADVGMENKAIKQAQDTFTKSVQDMQKDISTKIASAVLKGNENDTLHYTDTAIVATNSSNGTKMQFGAGGLIFEDRYGNPTSVIGSDGYINADLINTRNIVAETARTAQVLTGTIQAGVKVLAPVMEGMEIRGSVVRLGKSYQYSYDTTFTDSPEGDDDGNNYTANTVMSSAYGFSTTKGLNINGRNIALYSDGTSFFSGVMQFGAQGSNLIRLTNSGARITFTGAGKWIFYDKSGTHQKVLG